MTCAQQRGHVGSFCDVSAATLSHRALVYFLNRVEGLLTLVLRSEFHIFILFLLIHDSLACHIEVVWRLPESERGLQGVDFKYGS